MNKQFVRRLTRSCLPVLPGVIALTTTLVNANYAHADYELVNQYKSDTAGRRGFRLYLDRSQSIANLRLKLQIGDGTNWRWLDFGKTFAYGANQGTNYYWVKAIIPPTGKSTLYVNDVLVTAPQSSDFTTSTFVPYTAATPDPNLVTAGLDYYGRQDVGTTDYVVRQRALTLSLNTSPITTKSATFPSTILPANLYAYSPQTPIRETWTTTSGKTLTIQASFYLEPSINTSTIGKRVDAFGQSVDASWTGNPGKVSSLAALQGSWDFEENEYNTKPEWQPSTSYDAYGGYTGYAASAWQPSNFVGKTGFYRLAKNSNGFWWLVTPAGNPCFYIGIDSVVGTSDTTLYTGRENFFPAIANPPTETTIPPQNNSAYPVWSNTSDGKKAFGFLNYNLFRRWGADFATDARTHANKRYKAWGFSGYGKWTGGTTEPVQPVVKLPATSVVPRIAGNVYDFWDPTVQTGLRNYISGVVSAQVNNTNILGWSFGNENDGIVWDKDIVTMLQKVSNQTAYVPAKHEHVNYMRYIYGTQGKTVADLADTWHVPISTTARNSATTNPLLAQAEIEAYAFPDVDSTKDGVQLYVPQADITTMRRHFAELYYDFIYDVFKNGVTINGTAYPALDTNHLYFGFWVALGTWQEEEDWRIIGRHCDVIGYDNYGSTFADARLTSLLNSTNKPVMCGEFSFPAYYGGTRGFGAYGSYTSSDAESGSMYTNWVQGGAANKYCVGMHWFQYHDQPILGRGQSQDGTTPRLVLDENYAFGLADITDRPKWDFVKPVRAANLAAAPSRLAQPAAAAAVSGVTS